MRSFSTTYYVPIYFQSVYNSSPIESGVKMLALIIPLTIAATVQGVALSKTGIVPLFWIGYQILVGFLTGWTFQVALSNAQVHARPEDMSQVASIVNFFVTVGGSFFLSAAQSAFNNQLLQEMARRLPDLDPSMVLGVGATQIRQAYTPSQVPVVIDVYVVGLKAVFAITMAAFGVSTIIGFFGSWRRLHANSLKKAAGGAA
ncbi:hypothetical protein BP00DRAFT_334017 [Aspergillus indologenus CBS 114.80]|uniref:MFS general substrate transporter n=1 Tax=Aspergillus indologenus CBS 114.80 TaxID=1450541 RepID=A0A2V5IFY3_9EURO|nr:hypothetical protein BP00DRAFT_334017 [Aspergillus indologenus CBS 114.80]